MRARLLRALFLLMVAVMLVTYVVGAAHSTSPEGLHDSFEVVGEQWC